MSVHNYVQETGKQGVLAPLRDAAVGLGRSNPVPAALPALHAARDAEPDTTTRQFMTEAAGRRDAAYAS
jgi:hypothetical protein